MLTNAPGEVSLSHKPATYCCLVLFLIWFARPCRATSLSVFRVSNPDVKVWTNDGHADLKDQWLCWLHM